MADVVFCGTISFRGTWVGGWGVWGVGVGEFSFSDTCSKWETWLVRFALSHWSSFASWFPIDGVSRLSCHEFGHCRVFVCELVVTFESIVHWHVCYTVERYFCSHANIERQKHRAKRCQKPKNKVYFSAKWNGPWMLVRIDSQHSFGWREYKAIWLPAQFRVERIQSHNCAAVRKEETHELQPTIYHLLHTT